MAKLNLKEIDKLEDLSSEKSGRKPAVDYDYESMVAWIVTESQARDDAIMMTELDEIREAGELFVGKTGNAPYHPPFQKNLRKRFEEGTVAKIAGAMYSLHTKLVQCDDHKRRRVFYGLPIPVPKKSE